MNDDVRRTDAVSALFAKAYPGTTANAENAAVAAKKTSTGCFVRAAKPAVARAPIQRVHPVSDLHRTAVADDRGQS